MIFQFMSLKKTLKTPELSLHTLIIKYRLIYYSHTAKVVCNMRYSIPIAEPHLGLEEERLVLKGIRSGWISSIGEYILEFEDKFARYCDTKYGITTSNGTTSLHLALVAADIGPGDEVIVPSMTFVATANSVSYTGAKSI